MPAAWSHKDERQYTHILSSCKNRGRYGIKRCKSIAAATVNKRRRAEGRTLSGLGYYDETCIERVSLQVGRTPRPHSMGGWGCLRWGSPPRGGRWECVKVIGGRCVRQRLVPRMTERAPRSIFPSRRPRDFAGLDARLTYRRRKRLRGSTFCLPSKRKYPVPDCSHANNAVSRASAAYHSGHLTRAEYNKVVRCAHSAQQRLC